MKTIRAFVAFALLALSGSAWADFSGLVVRVLDGDTIEVLFDGRAVRIRLAEIDAPEKNQAFGTSSKQTLASMVFRRTVTVVESGPDRYGRTLGVIFIDGMNVNAAMVEQGMAWAYRQYVTDKSLFQLETQARAARRGLWADPAPVEPWLFRRNK